MSSLVIIPVTETSNWSHSNISNLTSEWNSSKSYQYFMILYCIFRSKIMKLTQLVGAWGNTFYCPYHRQPGSESSTRIKCTTGALGSYWRVTCYHSLLSTSQWKKQEVYESFWGNSGYYFKPFRFWNSHKTVGWNLLHGIWNSGNNSLQLF